MLTESSSTCSDNDIVPWRVSDGKELPPRFRRQQQMQTSNMSGNSDEISLRPARNFTMLRPNIPSMLPKSAQSPKLQQGAAPIPLISTSIEHGTPKPIMQKKSNIKIKQVASVDKPKPNKKTPSQDEIKQAMVSENGITNLLVIVFVLHIYVLNLI